MFRYPFVFIHYLSICLLSCLYAVLEMVGHCSEDTIQQFNLSYVVCYRASPVVVCFVMGQACCFIVMKVHKGEFELSLFLPRCECVVMLYSRHKDVNSSCCWFCNGASVLYCNEDTK